MHVSVALLHVATVEGLGLLHVLAGQNQVSVTRDEVGKLLKPQLFPDGSQHVFLLLEALLEIRHDFLLRALECFDRSLGGLLLLDSRRASLVVIKSCVSPGRLCKVDVDGKTFVFGLRASFAGRSVFGFRVGGLAVSLVCHVFIGDIVVAGQ